MAASDDVFTAGVDLTSALWIAAARGAAFVPSVLRGDYCARLMLELRQAAYEPVPRVIGDVRQDLLASVVGLPAARWPLLDGLAAEFSDRVRRDGRGIEGLDGYEANEAHLQRYLPRTPGIGPHLDGKRYRVLSGLFTLDGGARFSICRDRAGAAVLDWDLTAGDLVLLRGPGLASLEDGRPLHRVGGPGEAERHVVVLRMNVRGASETRRGNASE